MALALAVPRFLLAGASGCLCAGLACVVVCGTSLAGTVSGLGPLGRNKQLRVMDFEPAQGGRVACQGS